MEVKPLVIHFFRFASSQHLLNSRARQSLFGMNFKKPECLYARMAKRLINRYFLKCGTERCQVFGFLRTFIKSL